MNQKAQSGLEYLMTYGWATMLVAAIIGVLAFVVIDSPGKEFSLSDSSSFILKASQLKDGQATIRLQNITGGIIEIISLQASGYINCTINGQETEGITIGPGGEILIKCISITGGTKTISMSYTDRSGLNQTLEITGYAGTIAPDIPPGETICNDSIDNDQDNLTDCEDPNCNQQQGTNGTCEHPTETTCNDNFDNDQDNLTDCEDPNCNQQQGTNGTCEHPTETTCNDNFDNDQDNLTDCSDNDCTGQYCDIGETKRCVNSQCLPQHELRDCGEITQPGTYFVTEDLIERHDCIGIRTDNVILDCQNNSLVNSDPAEEGTAVYATNVNNITVRNCNMESYSTGIHFVNVANGTITNNNINENRYGIWTEGQNNRITDNTVNNSNIYGILIVNSTGNTITGNTTSYAEENGIQVSNSNNNTISNNTTTNNSTDGIRLMNSSYNNVRNNTTTGNEGGILLNSSSKYNNIRSNIIENNLVGIKVLNLGQSSLYSNIICNNNIDLDCYTGVSLTGSNNQATNITGDCGTITFNPCT